MDIKTDWHASYSSKSPAVRYYSPSQNVSVINMILPPDSSTLQAAWQSQQG